MESNSNSDNESNDVDFDELSDMLDDIYGDDDEETVEEIHENDKSQTTLPLDNSDLINPNMEFSKLNGSFLLNELSKLKDSSHEAVEGYESLSEFKQYLHVKREIQEELFNKLNEVKDKSTSQLIMLCVTTRRALWCMAHHLRRSAPSMSLMSRILTICLQRRSSPSSISMNTMRATNQVSM